MKKVEFRAAKSLCGFRFFILHSAFFIG